MGCSGLCIASCQAYRVVPGIVCGYFLFNSFQTPVSYGDSRFLCAGLTGCLNQGCSRPAGVGDSGFHPVSHGLWGVMRVLCGAWAFNPSPVIRFGMGATFLGVLGATGLRCCCLCCSVCSLLIRFARSKNCAVSSALLTADCEIRGLVLPLRLAAPRIFLFFPTILAPPIPAPKGFPYCNGGGVERTDIP